MACSRPRCQGSVSLLVAGDARVRRRVAGDAVTPRPAPATLHRAQQWRNAATCTLRGAAPSIRLFREYFVAPHRAAPRRAATAGQEPSTAVEQKAQPAQPSLHQMPRATAYEPGSLTCRVRGASREARALVAPGRDAGRDTVLPARHCVRPAPPLPAGLGVVLRGVLLVTEGWV